MSRKKKVLERWTRNVTGRAKFAAFIKTPEFEQGMKVLEAHAIPIVNVEESDSATAKRQSFQAGFYMCLELLEALPEIHYKKNEEILPPWEHIGEPNKEEEKEN